MRYRSRVLSAFPMPNRPTVLAKGSFAAPVQANLVIFRNGDKPRLTLVRSERRKTPKCSRKAPTPSAVKRHTIACKDR